MKILVADDDPMMRLLLASFLTKAGHEVQLAKDGREALEMMRDHDAPRLAILDWVMPEMDGVDVCAQIRSQTDRPYAYLLLLTSKGGQAQVIQGLDAGADDFLTKPLDLAEFEARLRVGQRIIDLQEQLMRARDTAQFQANHDPLTNLWNRAAIVRFLQSQFAKVQRDGDNFAVMIADLDHFKNINDTYGHPQGDFVLCEVTRRMSFSLRSYDWLSRYGGEEFLIIAPSCSLEEGTTVANRLRESVAATPIVFKGHSVPLTISVGVAATSEVNFSNEQELLDAADSALYQAKKQGRNRVCAADREFVRAMLSADIASAKVGQAAVKK